MAAIWRLCTVTFPKIFYPLSMVAPNHRSIIPNGVNKLSQTSNISVDWNRIAMAPIKYPSPAPQDLIERNRRMMQLRTTTGLFKISTEWCWMLVRFRLLNINFSQCNYWKALAVQSFCYLILYRWRWSTSPILFLSLSYEAMEAKFRRAC